MATTRPNNDLFDQFTVMTPAQLCLYTFAFNILVADSSGKEGILIGNLDLEVQHRETIKVLRDGELDYLKPQDISFIRAEPRRFIRI